MSRPITFKIDNSIDRNNFLKYLENNEKKVLEDLAKHLAENCNDNFSVISSGEDAFLSLWNKIKKATYVRDTPQDQIWEDTTSLLFMLPPKRVSAIRSSLRAKKKPSYLKHKKQLTIDESVYDTLALFAKSKKLTLSDALAVLLEGSLSDVTIAMIKEYTGKKHKK